MNPDYDKVIDNLKALDLLLENQGGEEFSETKKIVKKALKKIKECRKFPLSSKVVSLGQLKKQNKNI